MVAMLRTELVKAQGYLDKQASDDENKGLVAVTLGDQFWPPWFQTEGTREA